MGELLLQPPEDVTFPCLCHQLPPASPVGQFRRRAGAVRNEMFHCIRKEGRENKNAIRTVELRRKLWLEFVNHLHLRVTPFYLPVWSYTAVGVALSIAVVSYEMF